MARKRMITRTIKVTEVTVLGLSSESESARSVHYTIPGVFTKVTDGKVDFDYDKLLKLKGLMNTESGRRMAEERHAFLVEFLDRYREETEGER